MLNLKRRVLILITSGCLLCACGSRQNIAPADLVGASEIKGVSVNYKLAAPEITDLIVTATGNGYAVLPVKERLSFKDAGSSVTINVRTNSFVKKGDVLAELAYDQNEVQTNISLTQISIDKENADFDAAEREYENNLASMRKRINEETNSVQQRINRLRLEQLKRNHEKAVNNHDAAIADLTKDLEKYQAMTEPGQLTAPFDGFIDYTALKSGGAPAAAEEVLVEICDTSVYQLVFTGKADDFCYNMPVKLVLKDKAKTEMDGIIVSDNKDSDTYGKRSFVVQTPGKIPELRTVMQIGFAGGFSVTAESLSISGAMVVPSAAIQEDEKKTFVNIYENGAVKKRYVKTGAQSKDSVQILDGLSLADQVIIN